MGICAGKRIKNHGAPSGRRRATASDKRTGAKSVPSARRSRAAFLYFMRFYISFGSSPRLFVNRRRGLCRRFFPSPLRAVRGGAHCLPLRRAYRFVKGASAGAGGACFRAWGEGRAWGSVLRAARAAAWARRFRRAASARRLQRHRLFLFLRSPPFVAPPRRLPQGSVLPPPGGCPSRTRMPYPRQMPFSLYCCTCPPQRGRRRRKVR